MLFGKQTIFQLPQYWVPTEAERKQALVLGLMVLGLLDKSTFDDVKAFAPHKMIRCGTDQLNLSLNTLPAGARETHCNLGSEPQPQNESHKGKCT